MKETQGKITEAVKQGVKKTGEVVSSNPQGTLMALVGVTVLAGTIYAISKFSSGIDNAAHTLGGGNIEDAIDVNALTVDTGKTTITKEVARNYASQL